jgi:hypothetical protein
VETITVNYDNCVAPSLSNFSNNASSIVAAANAAQTITATITNATTQNIIFTQNGVQRPFNLLNGQFSAAITLEPGINSLVLTVNTNCGTAQHPWEIQFTPCIAPLINITNPSNSGLSVNASNFNFQANLQNITSTQGILFSLNGTSISNYSYSNGVLTSTLNLQSGLNTIVLKATNACGTDLKTMTIFYNNCVSPNITVSSPLLSNGTVSNPTFTYSATVQNMTNAQGILLSLNGTAISNFTFNNGQLSATMNLVAGVNTFVLTVSNACGSDMKTATVNYLNCSIPSVSITSPATSNINVTNAAYTFQATVQQMSSSQGINLALNGVSVPNFTYANGQVSASVNLNPGINTFVISVTNACGSDSKTQVLTYTACTAPQVTILNPINTNFGVSNPTINFQATCTNVNSNQGISLSLNGNPITNFVLLNGQISTNITLSNGMNTIVLSATNACGNDAQSRVIRYEPCIAPVVTITNPTGTTNTATSGTMSLTANVQNMTNAQGLSLTVNGVPVSNIQFNTTSGLVSANISLSTGNNSIVLSANGSCGSDSKTLDVAYNPCIAPIVSISNPANNNSTVSTTNFAFSANVQNVTLQQISLSVNGTNVPNFNLVNGLVTANLNLTNGNNEIAISVTNACGSDNKTVFIKFEECFAPIVSINHPLTANTTVTNASFNFTGTIQNIGNGQGISLTLNGNIIPNASFINGQISAMLNLASGLNQIVLTAVNNCGTDNQSTTITFDQCVPPIVTIQNPVDLFYGVNSPIFPFQATVQNMPNSQGINLTVAGNPVNNFNLSNSNFTATLNLPEGVNEIVLTATNACGTSSQLRTIRYQSCIPPVVNITTDPISGSTTNSTNLVYTANVTNFASSTILQLTLNGSNFTNFSNINGALSANISLVNGVNEVQLTAISSCGSDTKTYVITFDDGSPNGGPGNSDGTFKQNQQNQNKPTQNNTPTKPATTTAPAKPAQNTTPVKPTTPPPAAKPTTVPTTPPTTTKPTQTPVGTKPVTTNPPKEIPASGGGQNTEPTKGGNTEKGGGK